jgi:hypothetical protein
MRTMFLASLAIGFKDGQLAMIIHDFRENPPQENSVLTPVTLSPGVQPAY